MSTRITQDAQATDAVVDPAGSSRLLRRMTQVCGGLIAALGVMAVVGWATSQPVLLGFRASYAPMAPNPTVAFLALGLGLWAIEAGWRKLSGAMAVLVGTVVSLRLVEYATGVDLAVDSVIVRAPSETFDLAPVGKMALDTALGFVAASVSMGGCAVGGRRR